MKYYNLNCEVPGGVGNQTIFNKQSTPWVTKYLHVYFDGWMGGEILQISSNVIVSEKLQKELMFKFDGIERYETFLLETTETFNVVHHNTALPKFTRAIIKGVPFKDDIALTFYNGLYNQLIISDRFWQVLSSFNLGNYSIEHAAEDLDDDEVRAIT